MGVFNFPGRFIIRFIHAKAKGDVRGITKVGASPNNVRLDDNTCLLRQQEECQLVVLIRKEHQSSTGCIEQTNYKIHRK